MFLYLKAFKQNEIKILWKLKKHVLGWAVYTSQLWELNVYATLLRAAL